MKTRDRNIVAKTFKLDSNFFSQCTDIIMKKPHLCSQFIENHSGLKKNDYKRKRNNKICNLKNCFIVAEHMYYHIPAYNQEVHNSNLQITMQLEVFGTRFHNLLIFFHYLYVWQFCVIL